jgi:hypothetical protein
VQVADTKQESSLGVKNCSEERYAKFVIESFSLKNYWGLIRQKLMILENNYLEKMVIRDKLSLQEKKSMINNSNLKK